MDSNKANSCSLSAELSLTYQAGKSNNLQVGWQLSSSTSSITINAKKENFAVVLLFFLVSAHGPANYSVSAVCLSCITRNFLVVHKDLEFLPPALGRKECSGAREFLNLCSLVMPGGSSITKKWQVSWHRVEGLMPGGREEPAPAAWGTREALCCLCTAPYSPTLRKRFATLPCLETSQQAALLINLVSLSANQEDKGKKTQQNQHSISSVEITCPTLDTAYSTTAGREPCWRQEWLLKRQ